MSHPAVKLIYGDRTIGKVGVMFRGFGGFNSGGADAIEVVNVRHRAEYNTIGPRAA
jgi:hypothetical protein